MKKIVSIFLAIVIALSAVTIAVAEGDGTTTDERKYDWTCKTCGKVFNDPDEYNRHLDTHVTVETPTEPEQKEYQCETCKKIYDNIDDYNACVDSHFNNVNWHYDKYVDATVPDVLAQFVDIFNNTGLFDYLKEIISMLYETFVDRILPAKEAAADAQ